MRIHRWIALPNGVRHYYCFLLNDWGFWYYPKFGFSIVVGGRHLGYQRY